MKNNIINNIVKDYYKKEDILNKSYDDITNKILDSIENVDIKKLKFSKKKFDCILYGGGLKGFYLFGAIVILRKMINIGKIKIRKYKCISSGALAAVFLLSGISIHKMRNIYDFGKHNSKLKLNNLLLKVCNEILPENIHELCNDKVYIVVSKLTDNGMIPEVVSNFKSKKDLLNILYANVFGVLLVVLVAGALGMTWILGQIIERTAKLAANVADATSDSSTKALIASIEAAFGLIAPAERVEQPLNRTFDEMQAVRSWAEELADPELVPDWTDEPTVERIFRGQDDVPGPIDPTIGVPDMVGELG
jgi:hypothetical protein